jgi:hypothetical protein
MTSPRATLAAILNLLPLAAGLTHAQSPDASTGTPRVVIPTSNRPITPAPARPVEPASRVAYPWRTNVTCTVFWIGESPSDRNPTPNYKSSWDQAWTSNFGGFDDPAPESRIADFKTGEFRPKSFSPKLNPFYIALPYNDVLDYNSHKPEAARVIPWFSRINPEPGKTVCKGRWLQVYCNGRSCYAQWEDCGPWVTDDWEYVFGNKPPKNQSNQAAAIDISPAVRDYLAVASGQKVHWRFIEAAQVPYGPWKRYGQQNAVDPNLDAQRNYLERLRKQRDEEFMKKPLPH